MGSLPVGIPAGLFAPPAGMSLPGIPAARPVDFYSTGSPGTPSTAATHAALPSIDLFHRPLPGRLRCSNGGDDSLPLHLPDSGHQLCVCCCSMQLHQLRAMDCFARLMTGPQDCCKERLVLLGARTAGMI